ncbi:MAG: hypothetical protein IT158_07555 [Bryobacterales bacterium]|nr:hypothetical protein [Bryobacterales bacterium]
MKKPKPIILKRSAIRKKARLPMPPPEQRHDDRRRKPKYPPKDEEQAQ